MRNLNPGKDRQILHRQQDQAAGRHRVARPIRRRRRILHRPAFIGHGPRRIEQRTPRPRLPGRRHSKVQRRVTGIEQQAQLLRRVVRRMQLTAEAARLSSPDRQTTVGGGARRSRHRRRSVRAATARGGGADQIMSRMKSNKSTCHRCGGGRDGVQSARNAAPPQAHHKAAAPTQWLDG